MIPLLVSNSGIVRMTKSKFSNKSIVGLPPGDNYGGAKNLRIFVTPDGQRRSWIPRYTSPVTHKVTTHAIGPWPAISFDDALIKLATLRKMVAHGICPNAARKAERAAGVTFAEAAEQWIIKVYKPSPRNKSKSREYGARLLLFNHAHSLAKIPVSQITPDRVYRALQKIRDTHPQQGRRALAMMERVFNFAIAKGWRTGSNPAAWRKCQEFLWPQQSIENKHHAALPYAQMPEFMKGLRQKQESSTAAIALEFLIVTAARTDEVNGMLWEEIDWENKLWVLPPERTKQGREHTVPLSNRAMAILEQQRKNANGSPYVFNCYGREGLSQTTMYTFLQNMDVNVKVTVHGFRSTFTDWCGDETDFESEVAEGCLGHAEGKKVRRAYRRMTALEKRRVIMEAWAEHCDGPAPMKNAA
jgi:integrase